MDIKRFSIILSNYNQEKYIFEALDSILEQTYLNIELIISDDSSIIFEKAKIEKYIRIKREDIVLTFVINKKNVGTVKTYNKCLKKASGEFVSIIAADDKYFDKNVIKRYVDFFEKNKKANVVTSITQLYDNKFEVFHRDFPESQEYQYFEFSPKNQNKLLFFGPVFAPGATAYRTNFIKIIDYFEKRYTLIEDWSFFLKISRLDNKIFFINKPSLMHRGGGLSESPTINIKSYKLMICDTKKIYKKEIFPFFNQLKEEEISRIMCRFKMFVLYNNIFNVSIFIEIVNQMIFNKYYRRVLIKNKRNSILSVILTAVIIYVIMEMFNKILIAFFSIIIYKRILILINQIKMFKLF